MNDNLNKYSYLTAKERETISMPTRKLIELKLLKGNILDFGCGFGKDVEILKERGYNIEGYDPYYYPKFPNKKFDTILCNYVLNVLLPTEQTEVLMTISELLKPTGSAFYSVRDRKSVV